MLKIVYDIKSWISDYCEELHEHTVPKCFKFTSNEDGKAVMHYRNLTAFPCLGKDHNVYKSKKNEMERENTH